MLLGVSGIALIVSALQQFNSVDESPAVASVPTVLSATLDSSSVASNVTSTNEESKEVATSTNSPVPSLTLTSTPEVTPTPLSDQVASRTKTLEFTDSIFLRAGPGTNYDKLGSEPTGYVAPVTGKSEDGKWYQIAYGARNRVWVSADWVYIKNGTDDIPIVQAPATPTTTAIATENRKSRRYGTDKDC